LGPELIPVSWQSAAGDINYKPGGRLALLSTRHVVTFPAKKITLLGQYQIILFGDGCINVLCIMYYYNI